MTTTTAAAAPTFRTSRRSLGAVVALVLSGALAGGFFAQYWHAPATPVRSAATAADVRA